MDVIADMVLLPLLMVAYLHALDYSAFTLLSGGFSDLCGVNSYASPPSKPRHVLRKTASHSFFPFSREIGACSLFSLTSKARFLPLWQFLQLEISFP